MRTFIAVALFALATAFPAAARDQCVPSLRSMCTGPSALVETAARKQSARRDECGCRRLPVAKRRQCGCECAGGFWSTAFGGVCF